MLLYVRFRVLFIFLCFMRVFILCFCNFVVVMYAIGHIRPHSLFAGPSLSLTLRPPNLSLDGPTCLPGAFLLASYTCVTYLLWRRSRAWLEWEVTRHSPNRRDTGDIDWLESDIWPLNLAVIHPVVTEDSYHNGTVSDVLLVDIVDV